MTTLFLFLFVAGLASFAHADAVYHGIPPTNNVEVISKFVDLVEEKAAEVGQTAIFCSVGVRNAVSIVS